VEACLQVNQRTESTRGRLQMLRQLLNEAIEETRTAIYNLWPTTLDQIGLIPALRELIGRQEKVSGIRHSLRVYGPPYKLEPSAKIVVYRIVQEALNNIRQHASATSVDVLVHFSSRWLRITIRDDGKGFDVQSVMLSSTGQHFGLIGMRERALSIGGKLHVDSVPGRGCLVILEISANGAEFRRKESK